MTITPHFLAARHLTSGMGTIIDVRTSLEHDEKRLCHPHLHVPLGELNPAKLASQHAVDLASPIYLLCRSGKRATQAAKQCIAAGFQNVSVIEGGILACESCGQPLAGRLTGSNPGQKGPISLERQIRIAAGTLTVFGSILTLYLHPMWTMLPLMVGCGLMFAGITDQCGLGLLLRHAPWNKASCSSISTST